MIDLGAIRSDRASLLEALQEAGADVAKPSAIRCPFHDDKTASAGVYEERGVWRFKCQALNCGFGGDVFDVQAKHRRCGVAEILRGLKPTAGSETHARRPGPSSSPRKAWANVGAIRVAMPDIVEAYEYPDPDTGRLDMVVFRRETVDAGKVKKSFLQGATSGDGIVLEAPPKPWPLYNRARVRRESSVVVVEGEKCVRALAALGIVATTNPGGAGKARLADWSILAGKTVYLWADADQPDPKTGQRTGIVHMREVAKILELIEPPPRVLWVNCDDLGLPAKGDVVDYIAQHVDMDSGGIRLAVEAVLNDAEPLGASAEVRSMIEDTIAGRRKAIAWPWPFLSKLTKALLPGTVTALCGDPGSSKSFMLLEAAWHWHDQGIKIAIYELEEDRKYHLYRALAQRAGMSHLFDDEWVSAYPDQARYYVERHAEFLDTFGRCIHEAPDEQVSLATLTEWMAEQAVAGCRIVAIDPVTAATTSLRPWEDDLKFIMAAKTIARQFDLSVILVTHPRKGRKGGTLLDDLAGGAAYSRFSQCVLWLEQIEPSEQIKYLVDLNSKVTHDAIINRLLAMRKTRNARGAGLKLGYLFDGATLRFQEHGVKAKE